MDSRQQTRRYFFGKAASGLGIAALANLLPRRREPHRDSRTSRPRPSASSTCSSPAARRRWSCSTTSRSWQTLANTELPDSIRMGQRLTGMTSAQTSFPVAPSLFKFQQHGKSGAWVSELMPHLAKVADDLCFVKSMYTEQINHDPGGDVLPDRLSTRRTPVHRLVAGVRTRQREQGPAGVRRDDLAGQRQSQRSAAGRPPVGQRISAHEVSGREVPFRRRSGALPLRPAGIQRARAAAIHRRPGRAEPAGARGVGRPGDRDAHRAIRDGVQDANVGAGADRSLEGAGQHVRALRSRRAPARHLRGELSAGPAALAERGVRFVQLFHRGWDQHTLLPKQLPGQAQGHRPGVRRA